MAPVLLHFNVEEHNLYFRFSFLTSVDLFNFLFAGVSKLNTYIVPSLLLERVGKCNYYVSISTLISKNISGIFFVVSLSRNLLFQPFSNILTWKTINHTYLLAVYTLNTSRTPYFFVYNTWKLKCFSDTILWPSKHQSCVFFTSKLQRTLRSTLFVVSLNINVISTVYCSLNT